MTIGPGCFRPESYYVLGSRFTGLNLLDELGQSLGEGRGARPVTFPTAHCPVPHRLGLGMQGGHTGAPQASLGPCLPS